jgi:hypothetical protein
LIKAAFDPATPLQVLYGLLYSLGWIVLLYLGSRQAFRRWIIER